jgi:hypothetical protein
MKKIIALVMGIAFAFGTAGFAAAQTPATPKAEDKMDKKDDKDKTDKKGDKKGGKKKSSDKMDKDKDKDKMDKDKK